MQNTNELRVMALLLPFLAAATGAQTIAEIIDSTDSLISPLGVAVEIAVEGMGNVYVAGQTSDNAFKITPRGRITRIIDKSGNPHSTFDDGLESPSDVAVDAGGNVYVTGAFSENAFRITPEGTITEIIDVNGDGVNGLDNPLAVAVDGSANVYVAGALSENVFRITRAGMITEIIDATGDGVNDFGLPTDIAVDASGNVYVTGGNSNNAFRITPEGAITEIIDGTGDGVHGLSGAISITVDASGNVYVAGLASHNAFRITPGGAITEIIDSSGDGSGSASLSSPRAIAAEGSGIVYVAGFDSDNVFKITPDGTITEIIDSAGDGTHGLSAPVGLAVEGSGTVYVSGSDSDNVFKVTPEGNAISAVAGLVVPGFEVAVDDPDGPTTFFAARNTTDRQFLGTVDFFGLASTEPLRTDGFTLDPQETLTRNIGDDLSDLEIEDGMARGFAIITEFGRTTAFRLEGDYFRVDSGNDFATGDRLVRPADFCLEQEIRFVDFGSGSELRILLNRPRGDEVPSFSYTAYNQAGMMISSGDFSTSSHLTVLDVAELVDGQNFGTALFDFSNSGGGWVSARYSAFGRFSVELESACRD